MKKVFYIFLLTASFGAQAQYAVINASEGVNIISTGKKENQNFELVKGTVVYAFDIEGNDVFIDYTRDGYEIYDQVKIKDIKFVDDYAKVPFIDAAGNKITLSDNLVTITVTTRRFEAAEHELSFLPEDKSILLKIDGLPYWGRDGGIPDTEYNSIEMTIDGKTVTIPQDALAGLYEPTLHNTKANYDIVNDILYIHSMNSDGAGGYEVIWVIEKGMFREREVMHGF